MPKLKILIGENNPILRAKSAEIKKFNPELKKFVKDMRNMLTAVKGLGLSAPQVGKNIRMFVLILDFKKSSQKVMPMINPKILSHCEETEFWEEGCLSLPGKYGQVERYKEIVVEFFDIDGNRQTLSLNGLNARVVQHENDHLDGVLFVDRMEKGEK